MKILDFWAPWCGPCKAMGPVIDQIKREFPSVEIEKINIDEDADAIAKYGVASVPTLIFIKNDREINRLVGSKPGYIIKNIIESNLED